MEVPGRTKFILSEHMDKHCTENLECQPCRLEGRTVSAAQVCETCHKGFCSVCLTHHNRLFVTNRHSDSSINEMSGVNTLTDLSSEDCDFHKDQKVSYFCKTHDCVCCNDCLESQHTKCKVFPIDNVSSYYSNSVEFQTIRKSMEQLKEDIESSKNVLQYNLKVAMENKQKVIEEIKTFREEFNAYLDKAERELVLEIDQLYVNNVTIQKKILEYECVEKQMEDYQFKLDQCFDNTKQWYVTAKRVHRRLQACQKVTTEPYPGVPEGKYNFEPSKHLLHLRQDQSPIGRISKHLCNSSDKDSNTSEANTITDFSMKDKQADFGKRLDIQVFCEEDCCITGLALINAKEILLADNSNKSLKILNLKDGTITSMIRPPSKPYDVTIIRSDTAAASLPDTGKILFVNTKHSLSQINRLTVRKGCKGIAHRNGQLAVSFCQPSPAVQIMDMEGHTLHELKDTTMFRHPSNIALSNDGCSLFVSEFSSCTVYQLKIDDDLKIIAKYKTKTQPCGLAVTSDGTVTVCCVGDEEKVRMLVPKRRITLPLYVQDVQQPCSVLVCEQLKQMFICECNRSLDCNFIKIFSLK